MEMRSGELLRAARRSAGLTQAELAHLAATSQSAVAAYEGGGREPTLPVLERMLRAAGHLLSVDMKRDTRIYRLADLAEDIRAAIDDSRRLRLVFEFLRGADEDGQPLRLLVAAEPSTTGSPQFDALLAAMAEDRCTKAGVAPPSWTRSPQRFLDSFWWVSELPSGRARALVHTPAAYRRRGVMLERHDLEAA